MEPEKRNNSGKKWYWFLLNLFLAIIIVFPAKNYANLYVQSRGELYGSFIDFKEELTNMNTEIAGLLTAKDIKEGLDILTQVPEQMGLIKEFEVNYYNNSGKMPSFFYLYYNYDDLIESIHKSGNLDLQQEKHLNELYDFNSQLLGIYKEVVGELEGAKFEKKIKKISKNFIIKAEECGKKEPYKFIADYKYSDNLPLTGEETKKAEIFCKDLYERIIGWEDLTYTRGAEYDTDLIFANFEEGKESLEDKTKYDVEYSKSKNNVDITARMYGSKGSKSEAEIDAIAEEAVKKVDGDLILSDREVRWSRESPKKIETIKYNYKFEKDGFRDDLREVKVCVARFGMITDFNVAYEIPKEVPSPTLSKEDIRKKFNEKGTVDGVTLVRTKESTLVYEVTYNYGGNPYTTTFDAMDGSLEKFSDKK